MEKSTAVLNFTTQTGESFGQSFIELLLECAGLYDLG